MHTAMERLEKAFDDLLLRLIAHPGRWSLWLMFWFAFWLVYHQVGRMTDAVGRPSSQPLTAVVEFDSPTLPRLQ